ncbi:MAG: 40S ribosomal protein S19, partial [Nitrososphaerota archaeon]|nr:40S ribosomal protein S19 [Nitrososphaerota archaeon]
MFDTLLEAVHLKAVPADKLIERLAEYLRENVKEVSMPEWAMFVKTGPHRQRPPDRLDWWYLRAASILRKLYLKGPMGVSRLRKVYG